MSINLKKNLYYKLLFLFTFIISFNAFSEVNTQTNIAIKQEKNKSDISDADDIREALSIYSRSADENNTVYEQNLRVMLDSIEERFLACDSDGDQTLDVFETTQCLPQVARQFREVDIDNNNVISLHEIATLAKFYQKKAKSNEESKVANDQQTQTPEVSLKNQLSPESVN